MPDFTLLKQKQSAVRSAGASERLFEVLGPFQPLPPPGADSPLAWGAEDYVRARLGGDFQLSIERRLSRDEDDSPERAWEYFAPPFGPTRTILDSLEGERRAAFELAGRRHFEKGRRPDGSFLDEREHLLVAGIRR